MPAALVPLCCGLWGLEEPEASLTKFSPSHTAGESSRVPEALKCREGVEPSSVPACPFSNLRASVLLCSSVVVLLGGDN